MKIYPATDDNVERAAAILRAGGIVAMPTETVYGLAASIDQPDAISRVFRLKGRPVDNPLIVHLASSEFVSEVAVQISEKAELLMERFWPGPLTLVLEKQARISESITGGKSTVAVRVPAHPIARSLIATTGSPLAAPSANPFMGLSPTRADHIDLVILEGVDMVIDGGPCFVGLESTVVDCTGERLHLLRPGGISAEMLEDAVAEPVHIYTGAERRAPGQYPRHYAPGSPMLLVEGELEPGQAGLTFHSHTGGHQIAMPREPHLYAAALYAALKDLDLLGVPEIFVEAPPDSAEWAAVWDRLRRASTPL